MVERARGPETASPEPPTNGRLDSWKEIAAHLGRTVRTVQRWEKRGLPVHRHHHEKRGTVYADASEIDAWWRDRGSDLHREEKKTTSFRAGRRLPAVITLLPALLLLSAWAFEKWGAYQNGGGPPTPTSAVVHRHSPEPKELFLIGRPSPDGRYLSYSDENGELALFELATEKKYVLTSKGSWDESQDYAYFSAVSPDGEQVAYGWTNHDGDFMDLRVIGIEGGEPRIVHSDTNLDAIEFVQWAPDGQQILAHFVTKDGTNQMALVSAEGGSVRILKASKESFPVGMSLAPDGRYLAYDWPRSEGSLDRDIFLLDVSTGEGNQEFPIVEGEAIDFHPIWTPDGKRILFGSDRTETFSVWMLEVIDGRPHGSPALVQKGMGRSAPLGLTRDGAYFYYLNAGLANVFIARLDPRSGQIKESPTIVADSFVGTSLYSDWSPDGRYLAYTRAGYVVIRSMETGEERELSLDPFRFGSPQWSPDGRYLFFNGRSNSEPRGLYRVDVATSDIETVFLKDLFASIELSPDGKTVFYRSRGRVFRRELDTQQETELCWAFKFALSPDGRWMAFDGELDDSTVGLLVMPAEGGEPRELLRVPIPMFAEAWTADGTSVLFTRESKDGKSALWQIPVEGGEPQEIGLAMEGLRELRVHPDGSQIAFTAGWPSLEVWVMENFLPGSNPSN